MIPVLLKAGSFFLDLWYSKLENERPLVVAMVSWLVASNVYLVPHLSTKRERTLEQSKNVSLKAKPNQVYR